MEQEKIQRLDLQKIEAGIHHDPKLRHIVREIFLFEQVDSTNQIAMQMGAAGLPGRRLIVAEEQASGRGRLKRAWISPRGVNLYLSLLLRPHQPVRDFPLFSLASAIAVATAIQTATGLHAVLKWPNDVLYNDRKIAGILLESGKNTSPYLVIGIGVNVNWAACDIPPTLCATSLMAALGNVVDRQDFILHLLSALAEQMRLLEDRETQTILQTFSTLCVSLGRSVVVHAPHQVYEGVAERILDDGGLLLRLGDGTRQTIWLGDLIHKAM